MKRTIALLLLVVTVFTISSCAIVPAYNYSDLEIILVDKGYTLSDKEGNAREGITGYVYGSRIETGDEIYYIYCESFGSAQSIYSYINNQRKAKISEIKMEIERVEYALNKSEGVSAAEKGDYYEEYVNLQEKLDEAERYSCGRGFNVVWYGTKQAITDIRLG